MLSILNAMLMIQVSGASNRVCKAGHSRERKLKMNAIRTRVMILALLATGGLAAQDTPPPSEEAPTRDAPPAADPAAPPPLPLPPKLTDEEIGPSVEIRREEERMIEEYSINGRVYMVKITPNRGAPYYYFDEDGDGQLELHPGDEAMNPVRPAYWKVKEWK
jgi:hypothetical protein